MRILTVSHFFAAHGGGIELVAAHLNREFAALGHETSWAAAVEGPLAEGGATRAIGLRCVDWLERISGLPMPIPLPGAAVRLWRAVARNDAIIVHDALYASSILAMIAARWQRKPVLLIQHIAGVPVANPLLRLIVTMANRMVTRPMLRAADEVVFISETVRERFADVRFRRAPRLLFNGVDGATFRPARAGEREPLRARHGFGAERTILFVGRFVEKKGLPVLAELARMRPELRFVLVGKGPIDPTRWQLPNVTVLGHQTPERLAELYRAADLLVLPSVGEGFPLVIQEALASGLRAVCGRDTAAADPEAQSWLAAADIDLTDPQGTAARVSAAIDGVPSGPAPAAMAADAVRRYSWRGMAAAIVEAIGAPAAAPRPAACLNPS